MLKKSRRLIPKWSLRTCLDIECAYAHVVVNKKIVVEYKKYNNKMKGENVLIVLSVISAVSGILGAFFTASIALGFNEKMKTYLGNRYVRHD